MEVASETDEWKKLSLRRCFGSPESPGIEVCRRMAGEVICHLQKSEGSASVPGDALSSWGMQPVAANSRIYAVGDLKDPVGK